MADEKQIEDIINMLDNFVENGGGHMNIQINNPDDLETVKIDTFKSLDCSNGNMACSVPTLHKGIDD